MTNDPDSDSVRDLADLHVDTVRRENDHVDDRMAELESQVSELETTVSTLESEKADIEEDKEAAKELLAEFRDTQRDEQLTRIKQANEAVSPDNEVDLSTLEDASVDQLQTVAEIVEAAAGSQTVSNTDRSPEFSGVDDGTPDADAIEQRKMQVANDEGLMGLYEKAKSGDFEADHDNLAANDISAAMGGDQ